nr:phosphoenolpyruvate carboxylase gene [Tanacetum cinerariifolium]
MWRCTDELRLRAEELYRSAKSNVKHYIVGISDLQVIKKALVDRFVHVGMGKWQLKTIATKDNCNTLK